ncbi:hypothetical protein BD289DRAFT_484545 [Coniella lustricola]|uniref:Protection of telomeres protein 1 n=1 Tax=Coniella lustricola TaxID=2025994 RepID=A0A2T3A1L5_9PEZI|nr:hypothetical protein BD289DRAFT_484545 [Coniella lustricola]
MPEHQPPKATSQRRPALPPEFKSISELRNGSTRAGLMVSVIGVVKDYRMPTQTRGTDWKCCFSLYDASGEYEGDLIDVNVFRKEKEMPEVQLGDIVVATMAKLQNYNGGSSLVCTSLANIHVYDIRKMASCKTKQSALGALKPSKRNGTCEPAAAVNHFVYWLSTTVDMHLLPDPDTFATQAQQSLNVRDKFSLLQDVESGKFSDLVVQVVKQPFYVGSCICLHVSDYTENDRFHNKLEKDAFTRSTAAQYTDGDAYNYTKKFRKGSPSSTGSDHWIGPLGKKSMQVTCWPPHMDFVLQNVNAGAWVKLRNVQIREGHNHLHLEGFLREDRQYPDRIYVTLLDPQVDRERMEPYLLEALRRKREYEGQEKRRLQGIKKKRKLSDATSANDNSKSRRQKKRENKQRAYEERLAKAEATICLNAQVKCENPSEKIVPLSSILEPVYYSTTINDETTKLKLPFTNAKYRTQVRVIDYHPPDIKDFAASRVLTEYANLTDNEDDDSSCCSSSGSEAPPQRRPGNGERETWEWRFALRLEEVSASLANGRKPAATWVLVEHHDAQCLIGLDSAVNLRDCANDSVLTILRERLFKLWGNLEECKNRREERKKGHAEKPLDAPPASSDVEEDPLEGDKAIVKSTNVGFETDKLSNLPFICCLRQYGVKVRHEDGDEGDEDSTGTATSWQRVFGLFGTMIVCDKDDDDDDDADDDADKSQP